MGLNLPARSVIFTSPQKFDGVSLRMMAAEEYTQMAGRAGRRGLDTQGYAITLLTHWHSSEEAAKLLSRKYTPVESQYKLRYSSLLKLLRADGASASTVLRRTFAYWKATRSAASVEERRQRVAALLKEAEAEVSVGSARAWICHAICCTSSTALPMLATQCSPMRRWIARGRDWPSLQMTTFGGAWRS